MRPPEALDQVIGTLVRHEFAFEMHECETEVGVSYPNTVVFVKAEQWRGHTVVKLAADVVICVELSPETNAGIYFWLNQRNAEQRIAKFVLREGVRNEERAHPHGAITAELEIPVQFTSSQFLHGLREVSRQAAEFADPVKQIFGGETRADVLAEHRERFGPEPGEDGPSSETPF